MLHDIQNIRYILSLSQAFFKQYRIKNIWSPPGIEPRTACLRVQYHWATTTSRQTNTPILYLYCRGTAMLQSHSQQTNENSLFSKILFIRWIFFTPLIYHFIISFSVFFYSLDVFLCSIPGGDQIFLILYCLKKKKACERERIHLMSKRRLRKKLWHSYLTVFTITIGPSFHLLLCDFL